MHSKCRSLLCLGGALFGSRAGGCDDQVEPGYFGESLFTVSGSVEIANRRTPGELSPALGFEIRGGAAIKIVDGAVLDLWNATYLTLDAAAETHVMRLRADSSSPTKLNAQFALRLSLGAGYHF